MRASTSGGASTCRCSTTSSTSGAKRAIDRIAMSAISSRRVSQSPSASAVGTYWANTLMVWRAGGAGGGAAAGRGDGVVVGSVEVELAPVGRRDATATRLVGGLGGVDAGADRDHAAV